MRQTIKATLEPLVQQYEENGQKLLIALNDLSNEVEQGTAENEAIIRSLIESGANVNAKDEDDISPLLVACEKGYEAIVKSMIESGAYFYDANKVRICILIISSSYY